MCKKSVIIEEKPVPNGDEMRFSIYVNGLQYASFQVS